jgi:hypothetical protein
VRLQAALDRRNDELTSYRDSARLPVTLGEERFSDGVAVRSRRVELASLELARAERAARLPALPPVAELRQCWPSMSVDERRSAIGEVIDCAFLLTQVGDGIEPRVHVFLRGRAPVGLPAMGELRASLLPPFDPAAFPPAVRLRPAPDWDIARLRAELEAFTTGWERWPNFQEFQAAGRLMLYAQTERHGGGQRWARELGVPFVMRAPDGSRWTDEKIRADLALILAGRTDWPSWETFRKARQYELRRAVAVTGGPERWANEMGVHLRKRQGPISRPWSYTRMKAEVAHIAGTDKHYPTPTQFRAAGLYGLCETIRRRGLCDQIAADLGLTAPKRRTRRHRWTPELIRAELDEFLRGRDTWPVRSEFAAAGLGGLLARMYALHTTDFWAAQYGLTVRHPAGASARSR